MRHAHGTLLTASSAKSKTSSNVRIENDCKKLSFMIFLSKSK